MIKGTKFTAPVQGQHRHARKTRRVYAEKVSRVRAIIGLILPDALPYKKKLSQVLCYGLFRKGELIRISNKPIAYIHAKAKTIGS